jgi:hypothetical protein
LYSLRALRALRAKCFQTETLQPTHYLKQKTKSFMKIGIIGAGNIGSALAKKFVALGHDVSIANTRGPQSLVSFAAETGAMPVTIEQVVQGRDIVIIAIPQQGIFNLPKDLFVHVDNNTIIVDTGNYYPEVRDILIAEIDGGMLESEWVSKQIGAPIIKAFNSITVWSITTRGLPHGSLNRICISVAGDNKKHKQVILELIDQVGFDGIDAGSLSDSWRLQPGAPAYCMDLDKAGVDDALKKAEYNKIAEYRKNAIDDAKRRVAEAGSVDAAAANAGK